MKKVMDKKPKSKVVVEVATVKPKAKTNSVKSNGAKVMGASVFKY